MSSFLHKENTNSIKPNIKNIIVYFTMIMCCFMLIGCNNERISDNVKIELVSKLIEDKKVPNDTSTTSCDSYTISNAPLPSTTHYFYRIGMSNRYVLIVFEKLKDKAYHLDCKIVTWDGVKTREAGNSNIPDWKSSSSFDVYYKKTKDGYKETN